VTFQNALFVPGHRDDGRDGEDPYVFWDPRIVSAVNVALAARRPLLVTGPPGSGKSALAQAVARELGWAFLQKVITSRVSIDDLTARFDNVRRLADAQLQRLLPDWAYVEPGVLWWAFAPQSATNRGHDPDRELAAQAREQLPPVRDEREPGADVAPGVVLLIDEIDKAEPDLPNDLLEPLDRLRFYAQEVGWVQARQEVFTVITSNGERRLPPAFLRRCVQLELRQDDDPSAFLIAVAEAHFGSGPNGLYADVAGALTEYARAAEAVGRRPPSTAEYLDTIRACRRFGEGPGSDRWDAIAEVALRKSREGADVSRS
jgi:MoxR-like ATPase